MKIKGSLKLRAHIAELQDWNDRMSCLFRMPLKMSIPPFQHFIFSSPMVVFTGLIFWDKYMLRFIDD